MPAKKSKVVDKWKTKSWYTAVAPEMFESKEIGQVVAQDDASLANRVIKISLGEMIGSISPIGSFTTLYFRITEAKGKTAVTKFIGHELAQGYLKTLTRRRRSIINQVDDVTTKDDVGIRVKTVIVSANKLSGAARTAVRNAISTEVKRIAKETEFSLLAQEMIFGKFAGKLFAEAKKVAPIRRIEIRKTEVKELFT
jgi:small subunit ribosomal protein S3Ae